MKKLVLMVIVVMAMLVTLSACKDSSDAKEIRYYVTLNTQEAIIDDYNAGTIYSYDNYFVFTTDSLAGYMLFLEHEENNIEIIDISIARSTTNNIQYSWFYVTYTIKTN